MSAFTGSQVKGAMAAHRKAKREQAVARNRATPADRRAAYRRPTCPTGKNKYRTRGLAQAELVGTVIAKNRGDQRRHERRVYECPMCFGWHLTSQPDRAQKGGAAA